MNRIYTIDGRVVTEETPHAGDGTYVYWSLGYYQGGEGREVLRVWQGRSSPSRFHLPQAAACPKNWVLV